MLKHTEGRHLRWAACRRQQAPAGTSCKEPYAEAQCSCRKSQCWSVTKGRHTISPVMSDVRATEPTSPERAFLEWVVRLSVVASVTTVGVFCAVFAPVQVALVVLPVVAMVGYAALRPEDALAMFTVVVDGVVRVFQARRTPPSPPQSQPRASETHTSSAPPLGRSSTTGVSTNRHCEGAQQPECVMISGRRKHSEPMHVSLVGCIMLCVLDAIGDKSWTR